MRAALGRGVADGRARGEDGFGDGGGRRERDPAPAGGNALIGYALGAVIAPINFTLVADETSKGSTAQGYWFFMAGLAVFTVLLSVCCLRSGMQRYQVKIANKDDYEITN